MERTNKSRVVAREMERDELRARFTAWLDKTILRAKNDYIKKQKRTVETVSINDIPEIAFGVVVDCFDKVINDQHDFEFEEERLAQAFSKLPVMRREILRQLFVEEKRPYEIAVEMNCCTQHIHNQRSLAITKLRKELMEGGE